ncbi:MAG TPA: calcium/sodium antiporter [Woeseiaceae bacterium]|nr:calcium/sodium antiporter [Woeseiaceae bacterium]
MLAFLGIVLGIALLIAGGFALVAGASRIASKYGVPPMIVGLTVVGFGTSAPELVVNILGAITGQTELAFGNVIGSNIANLGLVLGAAAVIQTIDIRGKIIQREIPLLLLITTIITVMALDGVFENRAPRIGQSDAIVLLLLFAIFIYITVQDVVLANRDDALFTSVVQSNIVSDKPQLGYNWLLVTGGLALLFIGGHVTVKASVDFATQLGVSTAVIGLFVVAIGTSMPELVTSIIAAVRKESDLAIGNIIGSNIFNSLIVLPASALAAPVMIPRGGLLDLMVSWVFAAVLIPIFFLRHARVGRPSGIILLVAYFGYAVYRMKAIG